MRFRFLPSLPALSCMAACLAAFGHLGCGKLRLVEESKSVSPAVVLDGRRVLVATNHTREYERESFWTPGDLHQNDSRFFLIATDSPGVIRPLKTRASGHRLYIPNAAGTQVIFDHRTVFDIEKDALRSLPSAAKLLKDDSRAKWAQLYLHLEWGPEPGQFIVKASDWTGAASVQNFYLLTEKDGKFRFLGSDTGAHPVIGVIAQGNALWAAFRLDSSTIVHRPLDADTGGQLIHLPFKLTERYAIRYLRRWNGLWLALDCWGCVPSGERILRLGGPAEASDWERYDTLPGPDSVLNQNWVGISASRKQIVVWPEGKDGDSLVYDFADYLR